MGGEVGFMYTQGGVGYSDEGGLYKRGAGLGSKL